MTGGFNEKGGESGEAAVQETREAGPESGVRKGIEVANRIVNEELKTEGFLDALRNSHLMKYVRGALLGGSLFAAEGAQAGNQDIVPGSVLNNDAVTLAQRGVVQTPEHLAKKMGVRVDAKKQVHNAGGGDIFAAPQNPVGKTVVDGTIIK